MWAALRGPGTMAPPGPWGHTGLGGTESTQTGRPWPGSLEALTPQAHCEPGGGCVLPPGHRSTRPCPSVRPHGGTSPSGAALASRPPTCSQRGRFSQQVCSQGPTEADGGRAGTGDPGARPPQALCVPRLQRKLREAARKILRLRLEKEQLLELGNRLRAELGRLPGGECPGECPPHRPWLGLGVKGDGGGGQGASPPRGDSQAPALAAFVRKILQVSRAAGLLWLRQRLRVPRPAGASVSFAQSSSVWARHGLWAADARPPSCLGCWFPRKPPPCPMFAAQSGREGPGPALPAEGLSSARAPPPAEPGRQGLGGGLFPALSCVGSSRSFECVRKTPKETPSGHGLGRPLDGRGSGPPVPAPGVQGGRLAPLSSEAASGPWPPCQALPYRGTLPGSHGPRRFL